MGSGVPLSMSLRMHDKERNEWTMNKKERLMAVLNHQKPDRIPVGFWFHFEGEQADGDACVKAHVNYYRESGIDFIKIMSDGLGYPLRATIRCAADWRNVQPLPKNDPFFEKTVERCAAINALVGEECYTFYNFFSPFNIVRACDVFTPEALQGRTWDETVMAHLREDPDAMRHALNVIAGDLAVLAERVIHEGGCLGIYQSLQGAEKGRMSREEYDSIVKPSDMIVINAFNAVSPYNLLHMCSWAGFPNNLDYWKDYPCRVKNWGTGVEELPIWDGVSYFGPDTVLLGGLDNRRDHPLYCGNKEQVQQEVRNVLSHMGDTPFILGADCTVPNTIDLDHIRWVIEALEAGH